MAKISKICPTCNAEFFVFPSGKHRKFCSVPCKRVDIAGEKNPNFGKKWSEDQKQRQSEKIKSKITEEFKIKSGSANRGKKFSVDLIERMHGGRSKESYQHPHSIETKIMLGTQSALRFKDPNYKANIRSKMEAAGHWVSIIDLTPFEIYRRESHWIAKMWNYASLSEASLLKSNGIFHATKNQTGCVRDHKYSKFDGFRHGVYPEILRHPANCEIITHSDNSKKRHKSSISLQELFNAISNYSKEWCEQDLALKLILQYNGGLRWQKESFIERRLLR